MSQRMMDLVSRPEMFAIGLGLAAFLALYWVVRGAPIGQGTAEEPGEAPPSGYRDRAVAAAILAFLLIIGGAFVAGWYGIPWSVPVFAAGFGLSLRVIRTNRPYRHASPTLRRVVQFSDAALTCTLLAGILIIGNVFAFRYGGRPIDFTHDEAFTLESLSLKEVRGLTRPLRFTLLLGRSDRSMRAQARIRQLVDLYKRANPEKVTIEEIDAYNPAKAAEYEALLKRAPEVGLLQSDAIVLEYGEGSADRAVLGTAELFKFSNPKPGDDPSYSSTFRGEDAITTAIARFREGSRAQVGFTSGHGEPSIGELDPRRVGLGLWRERLVSVGVEPIELNLVERDVPEGTAVVVVVGPKSRFQDREVARLRAFMERGGPILVLMDGSQRTGLEALLALHNIAIDPGMVVDPSVNVSQQSGLVLTPPLRSPDHPIVEPLSEQRLLLPNASPLRIIGSTPARPGEPAPSVNTGVLDTPFLKTGPSSWVESEPTGRPTFNPATDRAGPVLVGIAATARPTIEGEKPSPRMVVLSTPLFAANLYLEIDPSNLDLVMNAVQWLRGRSDSLGVAPKVHNAMLFNADPNLRARLHLVPTILAFVIIVGFGVTTYLARRS